MKTFKELTEALDVSQRRARGRTMRKNKNKIALGRKRAEKKMATPEKLQKRADRQARNQVFQKLAKDTRGNTDINRKKGIETRLDKMKSRISKISRKLLPQIRKDERSRRSGKGKSE